MLRAKFGEKCIIMHFLGTEKDGKSAERRDAEGAEKENANPKAGPSDLGMTPCVDGRAILKSADLCRSFDTERFDPTKSLISTHLTRERCKSFVSTHIAFEGGEGGAAKIDFGCWFDEAAEELRPLKLGS